MRRAGDTRPRIGIGTDGLVGNTGYGEPGDAAGPDGAANDRNAASEAVAWAMAHLSEREAVFARADLFAAALAQPRLFPCSGISLRVLEVRLL